MIIKEENFISQEDINSIKHYLGSTGDWKESPDNPLWDKRLIGFENIKDQNIKNIFKNINRNIKDKLVSSFIMEDNIYCELFEFARTPVGLVTNAHSDSTGNNGEDNGTSHRKYSAILYLNNEFEGGNLVFTKKDIVVVPQPGMLVMFPSTFENMHNVEEVLSGSRYTITSFWTYDKLRAHVENYLERENKNGS